MTLLTRLSTRLILAGCLLAPASWIIAQAPRPAATHQDLRSEGFFEEVHAVKLPLRKYGYRGLMGDIVELNDSRLLMTYTQYDSAGEHTGGIAGRASTDQGRSWGPEFGLVARPNPPSAAAYHHPSFFRLANGDLLLSYNYYVRDSRPVFKVTYYRRSLDDGKTWGDQLFMALDAAHNDKVTQLSSGRLLVPVEKELEVTGGDHRGYVSCVYYSDNDGYSWRRSRNEVNMLPVEAQEPHVVELKDGRLLMLVRTYSGYVGKAYSEDQGETWSKGTAVPELSLPPNSSALNVKRIPTTGELLLVRSAGGADGMRTPFVSAISQDEGQTWVHQRIIAGDPSDDYGYPSLTFLKDMALVGYHKRDGFYVARIAADWFYERVPAAGGRGAGEK